MKFMIYLYISNVNVRSIHFVHLYARMNIYFEVYLINICITKIVSSNLYI